jgi:hypothetical protein
MCCIIQDIFKLCVEYVLIIIVMSVGNPWLRHSSHPQEKEGGPKKTGKKKKKKKHLPPARSFPARAGPPAGKLGKKR